MFQSFWKGVEPPEQHLVGFPGSETEGSSGRAVGSPLMSPHRWELWRSSGDDGQGQSGRNKITWCANDILQRAELFY